jgi:hypothetical protein
MLNAAPAHSCADCAGMKARTTSLMNENMRLHAELRAAQETMALHRTEARRLLADRCFKERAQGADENAKLLNLHVASLRLHEGRARQEVLNAIQEIVVNLIGSEEVALFELSPDPSPETASLVLVSSCGIDAARYAKVPLRRGIIGHVGLTGEAYISSGVDRAAPPSVSPSSAPQSRVIVRSARRDGSSPSQLDSQPDGQPDSWSERNARDESETELTACVPLRLCGRVVGVLAMFRLLEQKHCLVDLDRELLELVSMQAAPALYCAQLLG